MNPIYLIGIFICTLLFSIVLATFSSLSHKDTANNSKLLTIIIAFSIVCSLFAYGLSLFYFSRNPDYLIHFILAVVMLVMLPGTLISTSVAAVTISNLRDIVANN